MRTIIFILINFCLVGSSNAQKPHYSNNQIIDLDPFDANSSMPSDFTLKKGDMFRYRIKNFNRSLYTVTINSTPSSLFTDKPAIFGLVDKVDVTKLTTTIDAAKATVASGAMAPFGEELIRNGGQRQADDYATSRDTYKVSAALFNTLNDKVNEAIRQYNYLIDLYKDPNRSFKLINEDKLNSTYNFLFNNLAYTGSKTDQDVRDAIDQKISKLFMDYKNSSDDATTKYAYYKLAYTAYQAIATNTLSALTDKKKNIEAEIKKADDKKKEADTKSPGQTQFPGSTKAQATELSDQNLKILNLNTESAYETGVFALAADLQTDIKTAYSKEQTLDQSGFKGSFKSSYNKIAESNFEYTSTPIKASKDLITVKIDIEPKDPGNANADFSKFNGDFVGHITGWKINFSSGLFGIMGKNMFDQTYRLDPSGTDNVIIKKNDNKNWITPAFGALMHFYVMKESRWFNWGGNIGMSISGDTHVNFHGGLSFIMGDEQRVILSIGPTLAQAKQITDQYKEDQILPKTISLNPVPTQGYYRVGWFFSLTYNLSNL
jgi:hypothetical protein